MEKSLAERDGNSPEIKEKNRIRGLIKSYFPKRACFSLIRPIDDDTKLQKLDTSSFKEQYKLQLSALKDLIFSLSTPKNVGTSILNGSAFLRLVEFYVLCLNKGGVPVIEDAWRDVSKKEIDAQLSSHIDTFKKEIVYSHHRKPLPAHQKKNHK